MHTAHRSQIRPHSKSLPKRYQTLKSVESKSSQLFVSKQRGRQQQQRQILLKSSVDKLEHTNHASASGQLGVATAASIHVSLHPRNDHGTIAPLGQIQSAPVQRALSQRIGYIFEQSK